MAVDVKTGRRKWHYQTVHHDLWDYDLSCAPILFDMQRNGRTIKAIAHPTKPATSWKSSMRQSRSISIIRSRIWPSNSKWKSSASCDRETRNMTPTILLANPRGFCAGVDRASHRARSRLGRRA